MMKKTRKQKNIIGILKVPNSLMSENAMADFKLRWHNEMGSQNGLLIINDACEFIPLHSPKVNRMIKNIKFKQANVDTGKD